MLKKAADWYGVSLRTMNLELAKEESKIKHGLFTYAIIKAIKSKSADMNNDKAVSIKELSNYIELNFEKYLKKKIS